MGRTGRARRRFSKASSWPEGTAQARADPSPAARGECALDRSALGAPLPGLLGLGSGRSAREPMSAAPARPMYHRCNIRCSLTGKCLLDAERPGPTFQPKLAEKWARTSVV